MEWVFIKIDMKIVADRNIPFLEGDGESFPSHIVRSHTWTERKSFERILLMPTPL